MSELKGNRDLTAAERRLVRWMLEHGGPEAEPFFPQLDQARVTSWRCPCGCASLTFIINGHPAPSGRMSPISDFLFGSDHDLSGVFAYEQSGVLAGVEVYGLAREPPEVLPAPEALHVFGNGGGG